MWFLDLIKMSFTAAAPDSGQSSFTSRHGMLKFIKKIGSTVCEEVLGRISEISEIGKRVAFSLFLLFGSTYIAVLSLTYFIS